MSTKLTAVAAALAAGAIAATATGSATPAQAEAGATTRSAARPAALRRQLVIRLRDRRITATSPRVSRGDVVRVGLTITFTATGRRALHLSAADFALSLQGDMFAARAAGGRRPRLTVRPRRSRRLRLVFTLPATEVRRATLVYRRGRHPVVSGWVALYPSRGSAHPAPTPGSQPSDPPVAPPPAPAPAPSPAPPPPPPGPGPGTLDRYVLTGGVGQPWGTAIDAAGNVWFAEPGCDFAPTCAAGSAPGQIGVIVAATQAIHLYPLPDIPGNQPLFLAFDDAGMLWFTTPGNDRIGEFDPSTGQVVGQWPVTSGTGPWQLAFAGGRLWYTEHLASAIGRFDPETHEHVDIQTPAANSNPYGIAAAGSLIWFTENNSAVARVGVVDTARGNAVTEYPIAAPPDATPHLIAVGPGGRPWWTEGWANTIATLGPETGPGDCSATAGACSGVRRYALPPASACGAAVHTSGIAIDARTSTLWLDNSLTAQVGSFDLVTGAFAMRTLDDCNSHPHDGLLVDGRGAVWFNEQFANAIGRLTP
jgi:streptogramin lyase